MKPQRVPTSTHRIQFNLGFRFVDARDLIPYLHQIGITDLYTSPSFRARRRSSHGYDVADPFQVNSELGTDREFGELVERLKTYRMGLLLDIVPNHMAASSDNRWWLDVMESGPVSPYASFFDIDWHPPITKAIFLQENRVLLPILGDLFGNVLENQELTLKLDESGFFIRYYDTKLPLDPKTYRPILQYSLESLSATPAADRSACHELSLLIEKVNLLPGRESSDQGQIEKRRQDLGPLKHELWRLFQENQEIKADLEKTLHVFNGAKGDSRSFDRLDQLLAEQVYRLAFWKLAAEEINYRRFFDISDLVGLRVEDAGVSEARHAQIFQLIKEGKVTGLRIDHIDGLRDPLCYLQRLQAAAQAPAKGKTRTKPFFVVAEKILAQHEVLPQPWPLSGTTGYDFLNLVNGVLIDPAGLTTLREIFHRFTESKSDFHEISYRSRKQVAEELFAGEINLLAHALGRLAAHDRRACDVPLSELRNALIELTACLPVYRTYIRDSEVSQEEWRHIEQAFEEASQRTPPATVGPPAFTFLRNVLLLDVGADEEAKRQSYLDFVLRWQQFTGALMAKGVEDTTLYRYNVLVSMNEVGGNPGGSGTAIDEFHRALQFRQKHMPCTLDATSTHDTKRSEDVRARISVLSEFPSQWAASLQRWGKWNLLHKQTVNGRPAPAPDDEILFYQTLVGAWPLREDEIAPLGDRLKEYMTKIVREAKVHTNWLHPNAAYEGAVGRFVESLLKSSHDNRFLTDFLSFHQKVAQFGALNSLSQVLLKITAPGIPDFYQGTELWDSSLVDPDNRRPVDFRLRLEVVEDLRRKASTDLSKLLEDLLVNWQDGRIKFFITAKFTPAGRFPLGKEAWKGTLLMLPKGAPKLWMNVFTEQTCTLVPKAKRPVMRVRDFLKTFPVALLAGPLDRRNDLRA